MRILAVETATPRGSVSLVSEQTVIGEQWSGKSTSHTTWLLPAIELLLAKAGLSPKQIDGFAVSGGPGSFTGLRIGLSTVKGLSLAMDKPMVVVPTLDVLAEAIPRCRCLICPIIDARKNEVYAAFYRRSPQGSLSRQGPYFVLPPRSLVEMIDEPVLFMGNGVDIYRPLLEKMLGKGALFTARRYRYPRAAVVGRLGIIRLAEGAVDHLDTVEPLYIRPSEAELKKAGRARREDQKR